MNISSTVYQLMERWAVFSVRRECSGLGYAESSLNRMIAVNAAAFAGEPDDLADSDLLLVEAVMARLNPLVASAIRAKYLWTSTDDQRARRLGISRATLHRRVHDGLIRVQEAVMLGFVDFDERGHTKYA